IERDVRAALEVAGGFNTGDPARAWQADVGNDVGPALAPITSYPQGAIICAGIENVGILRRFRQSGGAPAFGGSELGRDDLQIVAAIERTKNIIASGVKNA